tara:strand:+ start:633 stop:1553 length:921 start_codon:yes stop_codon:yes gene_type:complete
MTNTEKNICSIIIGEEIKYENNPSEVDIDFKIQNDHIFGKIEILKSSKKFLINLSNVKDKKFNLELEISLNENSFLELRDESDYEHGSDINIRSTMNKNSIFEFFRLNNFKDSTKNTFNHNIELALNCEFRDFNFSNGSNEMDNKTTVLLNEENASYVGSGVMISNSTNSNNDLSIKHLSKSAKSDCSFKTVSRGNSNIKFSGKVFVDHDCSKTISNQISKGLIMDEFAKISLIPKLEINNDDVVCAHGAASGKPDRSVIFYLKSRGIPQNEAEKIYVEGFLGEFLDKIPNAEMQQKAMKYISANC